MAKKKKYCIYVEAEKETIELLEKIKRETGMTNKAIIEKSLKKFTYA